MTLLRGAHSDLAMKHLAAFLNDPERYANNDPETVIFLFDKGFLPPAQHKLFALRCLLDNNRHDLVKKYSAYFTSGDFVFEVVWKDHREHFWTLLVGEIIPKDFSDKKKKNALHYACEEGNRRDVERLLDLGCGPGTYSLAIVERHPRIRATLLDLPGPIAEARRLVEQRDMSDRVEFESGDAMSYRPDKMFDSVLISNTLHMLGPINSLALLKHSFDLVSPGGRIIVQAQYLNDDRISPRWPEGVSGRGLDRVPSRHCLYQHSVQRGDVVSGVDDLERRSA